MKKGKLLALVVFSVVFAFSVTSAWSAQIVIKGSTTVLPIAQKLIEAYMDKHPDVKISLSGGGSGNGIKALIDGSTDIANASRFIKDKEVKMAVEKDVLPVPFAVAYDSIIPVVHTSNKNVDNLTIDQLKKIYEGKIRNWKEVGGPDLKIVVCSRDTSSGTYETWEKKVMGKSRVYPGAQLLASNGAVVQAVSNNKHAIGYIGIGYLDKSVKGLDVNGITGTPETTLDGSYPISRALFMFTNGWPTGEVKKFINFALNPYTGQKYVKESGYVKLY
jgi:phosphate transport system substrate-binding protein